MTRALRIVEGADEARRTVLLRDGGPLAEPVLPEHVQARIVELFGEALPASAVVARIIDDVRREGDEAVRRYSRQLDGSSYEAMEVTREEIDAAFDDVPGELLEALKVALDRVHRYHQRQAEHGPRSFTHDGIGMSVNALQRAGIYMAGSDTVLPSTVIHTAVPATVVEVPEIIGVTAARADGSVHPLKLVAAHLAGMHRIFRASGVQGIAALAFGTQSVPRVDKIFGPGNVFVTLAKRQLYGVVGIDALYGPTETLVLADETAAPDLCAADLLAQAEHDELATPVLITTSRDHAEAVAVELEQQLAVLDRATIARAAVERGGAVVAADLDEALTLANEFAPEHLCLLTENPELLMERVTNAGGIFLGEYSPEVLGDYVAGPSHVMPTGGTARFSGPLSVFDFLKITSTIDVAPEDFRAVAPYAATLARAEGLTGHARSIELRLEGR